ncbi:hypothetical protein EI427_05070 [Flammeovirga pectinis]|uniref:Glycosyl-hydrolase 97 N-terminal domain-containing protein n=1 Tax=Flammeovirga pectinis TaxID=2494373 RepID=A0A3S9P0B6_9BACT|nr:hypothetical protein EI427_05070 [Flammeovirga pectinis]
MKNYINLSIAIIFSMCMFSCTPTYLTSTSPDETLTLEFDLDKEGKPWYKLTWAGESIIEQSYLGFDIKGQEPLSSNFEVIGELRNTLNQTWEQPWGRTKKWLIIIMN